MADLGLTLTPSRLPDPAFWAGRRVLLTGHTGFKGAWAWTWLRRLGAEVVGLSLTPSTEPSLAGLLAIPGAPGSFIADLRDPAAVDAALGAFDPEIVVHMAARALVPEALREPVDTFSVNVVGTAALLERARSFATLRCVLTVTSDKVYMNRGSGPFAEDDPLGGDDPYSASKAAQEMVVNAWRRSFFADRGVRLLTARGGNVVGGGDWSADRLVPDIVRALAGGGRVALRDPSGVRPWQHVLDALNGYLCFAESAMGHGPHGAGAEIPDALNFGPESDGHSLTVGQLVERFQGCFGLPAAGIDAGVAIPVEKRHLRLSVGAAMQRLGWRPRLDVDAAIAWAAAWYKGHRDGQNPGALVADQIEAFETP